MFSRDFARFTALSVLFCALLFVSVKPEFFAHLGNLLRIISFFSAQPAEISSFRARLKKIMQRHWRRAAPPFLVQKTITRSHIAQSGGKLRWNLAFSIAYSHERHSWFISVQSPAPSLHFLSRAGFLNFSFDRYGYSAISAMIWRYNCINLIPLYYTLQLSNTTSTLKTGMRSYRFTLRSGSSYPLGRNRSITF